MYCLGRFPLLRRFKWIAQPIRASWIFGTPVRPPDAAS
jgi:hypothetical protein